MIVTENYDCVSSVVFVKCKTRTLKSKLGNIELYISELIYKTRLLEDLYEKQLNRSANLILDVLN